MGKGPHPEYPPFLICEEINMKCRICKEDKDLSEFYKNNSKKNNINSECKECSKEFRKEYYQNNKEKINKNVTAWIKNNPKRHKHNELMRKYNITYEGYIVLEKQQKAMCIICGKTKEENGQDLAVDHCHKTGIVRGLLCKSCNRGLGMFQDNPKLVLTAYRYLKDGD